MPYTSFVIRLWRAESGDPAGSPTLRGHVEHVQTGVVAHANSLEEMMALLHQAVLDEGWPEAHQSVASGAAGEPPSAEKAT